MRMPPNYIFAWFRCVMIMHMSLQPAPPTQSWRRLVPAAFAVQAAVSLVAWFLVNDRSRGRGVWVTSDFEQWATVSAMCAAMLVVFSALVLRSWLAASAVAAGYLLAGMLGLTGFVGWAVFNSA